MSVLKWIAFRKKDSLQIFNVETLPPAAPILESDCQTMEKNSDIILFRTKLNRRKS